MSRGRRALVALVLLVGCGDDGVDDGVAPVDASAGTDAGRELGATIRVTVTSDVASFDGVVRVGAFLENPPMTPPVGLDNLDEPVFPATAELLDMPAGTYHVLAILDVDPPSPTIPGPEDVVAATGPLTVTGEDLEVSVDLPAP